jgi:hypothetical protein
MIYSIRTLFTLPTTERITHYALRIIHYEKFHSKRQGKRGRSIKEESEQDLLDLCLQLVFFESFQQLTVKYLDKITAIFSARGELVEPHFMSTTNTHTGFMSCLLQYLVLAATT